LSEVKYTTTHEWIEVVDSEGIIGITERAQIMYDNIIFVELPAVGDEYEQNEIIGRVEAADGSTYPVHAPVTGEVKAVNSALAADPDLINHAPEGDGWICRATVESLRELDILMDAEAYDQYEEEVLDEEYMDEENFYDDDEEY
jgi:glycine cleavage system H protein